MRFIHTGDIHWGMIPDADKPWGKERAQAIKDTFRSIVDYAREKEADCLFISGDLFHRQPLARDLKEVNYLFSTIPTVKILLIAGNHDRIRENSALLSFSWAPNVTFLMEDHLTSHYFEDINTEVYGFSYHKAEIKEPLLEGYPGSLKQPHPNPHGSRRGCLPSAHELQQPGTVSIFLHRPWHIHKPQVMAERKMAYCGSPEPLDITETGPHGFFFGEIHPTTRKITHLEFVPISSLQYIPLAVNVTPDTTNGELADRIAREIEKRGDKNIYRFRIKGMRDPETEFDLGLLLSRFRIGEIIDDSEPQYDFSALFAQHSSDMIGFFIQASAERKYEPRREKGSALRSQRPAAYHGRKELTAMKILDLHIDGFGKFHNRDISFSDGLNIVYGKNEAGKSTLHTLSAACSSALSVSAGEPPAMIPTQNMSPGQTAAPMKDACVSNPAARFTALNVDSRKGARVFPLSMKPWERRRSPLRPYGTSCAAACRRPPIPIPSASVSSNCATDQGMVGELRNYIANLNTSGSIALNITKASAYLRSQRREVESQMVPEAARTYASLLGEIRKMEQEIASPRYANQLAAFRSQKNQVKKQLEDRQKEKEALLEKAAKGRQILLNSQFTDPDSVTAYTENAKQLFADHQAAQEACAKKSRILLPFLFFLLAAVCVGGSVLCLAFPALTARYLSLPLPLPAMGGGLAGLALVFLAGAFFSAVQGRRFKKERGRTARLLSEYFPNIWGTPLFHQRPWKHLRPRWVNSFV